MTEGSGQPKIHVLRVAKAFQPETAPFVYPAHNGQYGVEQDFLVFLKRHPELLTDDPAQAEWHYLPLFWTNWHLRHDYAKTGRDELQAEVSRCLIDPARTFTICQYDDGPVVDVGDTVMFYSSRKVRSGHDVPLLCAPHTSPTAPVEKRYLASFLGRVATHPVRARMQDALKNRSDVCIQDGEWGTELFAQTVRASYLALCPRGYGGGSFRFYEAMQLGVAPCLIGDIDTRPFKERIPWDECSLYARDADELTALLDACAPDELLKMGARAKEVYDEHLAYQRWCGLVLEDLGIPMDGQEHNALRDILSTKHLDTRVEIGDIRVSFIVPCYDCADTVVDAVESIYQQHLEIPFEVVCTDDCSTDATLQMLESLARRHPQLKVLRHDRNRGGAAARNTCVRNSSGGLIFCLDADNVLAPNSVGLLIAALGGTGCEAAAFAALNYFQIENGVYRELEPWTISAPGNVCGLDHIMSTLRTPASSGNYLYTRSSYDRAGGYPEGRGAMDAWGFGFRQHATGTRIAVVPDTFYLHRVSPNGYWMTEQRKGMNDINAASVVLEFSDLLSEAAQAFLRSPDARSKFIDYIDKKKFAVAGSAKSGVLIDLAEAVHERIALISGSGKPLRLHLGCGERMLAGYVNIDYPPSEHTVQNTSVADEYADITTLSFPDASVDEVRLHHLFEHFATPVALALLCRWHSWLKDDGVLCIETPDVLECSRALADPAVSYKDRQAVLRHVFGSHEAHWAVHKDGWYEEKFRTVLGALGFGDMRVEMAVWMATRNITVTAKKTKRMSSDALCAQSKALLRSGMIDDAASEERLWRVWCNDFDQAYALNRTNIRSLSMPATTGA